MRNKIDIEDKTLALLLSERERTGISVYRLLSNTQRTKPFGLNANTVQSWLSGKVKRAKPEYIDFVIKEWAQYPSEPWHTPTAIELKNLKALVSSNEQDIFNILKLEECPKGLNRSIITNLITKRTKRIRKPYFDYLHDQLDKRPLLSEEKRKVVFSSKDYRTLLKYRDKYGFLPGHIFKVSESPPDGLNPVIISGWFSSKPDLVNESHLKWILNSVNDLIFKNAPSHATLPEPTKIKGKPYTTLNDEILKELKAYKTYGFLPGHILKVSKNPPIGLKSSDISRWLSGRAIKADTNHLLFILQKCRKHFETR